MKMPWSRHILHRQGGVLKISWLKQEFCVKFGPRIRSQKLAIDQPSRSNILAQQIAHGFMLSTPLVFHSRREHEKLLKPLRAMTLFEYYKCICFSQYFLCTEGSSLLGQKYPRRHFVRIKSGVSHLIINDVIKGKKEWSVKSVTPEVFLLTMLAWVSSLRVANQATTFVLTLRKNLTLHVSKKPSPYSF